MRKIISILSIIPLLGDAIKNFIFLLYGFRRQIFCVMFLSMLCSCYYDNFQEIHPDNKMFNTNVCTTPPTPTYTNDIAPIIGSTCAVSGCHDAATSSGGWHLNTYEGVRNAAESGRMFGAINHEAGFSAMPKNGPQLDSCKIKLIKKWIDSGLTN